MVKRMKTRIVMRFPMGREVALGVATYSRERGGEAE